MNKQRKTSHILNVFQYDETTGAVTLPASLSLASPDSADNSTKVATTAWIRTYVGSLSYATSASVTTAIANLVASAPTTLDTLNELATALGNDPNFATTMSTSLGNRLRIDTATQGLTATQQGYGRTNLGLGTAATSNTGDFATAGHNHNGTYVPVGRTITINGTAYDLSADRSWTIASYSLPIATASILGGVKIGSGVSIDAGGVISVSTNYQAPLSGTGFVKISGTTISYDNSTYLTTASAASTYLMLGGGTMTGALIGTSAGFTGYVGVGNTSPLYPLDVTGNARVSGQLILGSTISTTIATVTYTYTLPSATGTIALVGGAGVGTVTSVSGTGTVSGLTLTGTVTSSGSLTLGGTLSLTSGQVTTALGYTPYNSTNPSGYITGITSGMVTTALGYTPYNSSNPAGYVTASALSAYLPLAGGTMTGALVVSAADRGFEVNASGGISFYSNEINAGALGGTGTIYLGWRRTSQINVGVPISSNSTIAATGAISTTVSASAWGFLATTSGYSNGSGIWFSSNVGELLLRKADGTLSTRISADGTNAFINNNNILHAGNYSSYSPTLTGGGASGTWNINVTGNANNITQYTINQNLGTGNGPTFADVYTNGWFRNNNNLQGLYSQANNIHFYANSAGYWNVTAGGRAYGGIKFFQDHETTLKGYVYWDGSGFGLLNNQGGWSVLAYQGASYGGELRGTWSMGGNTILTNSNYSSYALSRGGDNTSSVIRFTTNNGGYNGSLSSASLQVFSDSNNAAYMSFHKGGYYAVNFGLDADNVMRIGGWSASSNRWQLDMSGNQTIAGTYYGSGAGLTGTASSLSVNYASTANQAYSLPTSYVGGQQLNPQVYFNNGVGLKVAMTASWGYWSDTMWVNGYAGGDVPWMCALHFQRNSQPRMAISAQQTGSTGYGTLYEVITTWNIADQTVSTANNLSGFDKTNPTFGAVYATNWFRAYGDCGLYSQDYGGHIRRCTTSYGTWENFGYTKNGWGGFNQINNYYLNLMSNTSGDHGFYQENGNGWTLFYNRGNNCWGIGTDNTYSGDGFRVIKYGSAQYGWTTWSDRRAKENISNITGALDTVLAMRGVYFNYIQDESKNKRVGFIAQELESVLPEAVRYAEEIDEYSVEYAQIVSVLAEAIKEQDIKMKAQDAKIQRLEQLVEQLINQ